MKLSDHDLLQLTDEDLEKLPEEVLRVLSVKLLNDLKEARERLRQTSRNSSRPPSSDRPWDVVSTEDDVIEPQDTAVDEVDDTPADVPCKERDSADAETTEDGPSDKRNAGKQPGATGYGRQQQLPITQEQSHYPMSCACCESPLDETSAKAYTAFETVDIEWTEVKRPGIQLINTKHTYYETDCACGHCNRQTPHRHISHPLTPNIELCEWRLVGPGLAALIVCLAYRMRLSRKRIQEFLKDWLGLELSVGTINATLHESGAAALAVEEQLVQVVQDSGLLHVDETSWPESTTLLWLWVFCGEGVVAYWIAARCSELVDNVLGINFRGWLMSDGYRVYRHFLNRLRCWAHLIRKAQGLKDGLDPDVRLYGTQTLTLMNELIGAVRAARERPPDQPLSVKYQCQLENYRRACGAMSVSSHEKARALATEMLNDWDAIFQVLAHPHLPLTNNEAERALRHWVIFRSICHGTHSEEGTRIFAILISVIETCRVREQSPWVYLATVIRQRRAGLPVQNLPEINKGLN